MTECVQLMGRNLRNNVIVITVTCCLFANGYLGNSVVKRCVYWQKISQSPTQMNYLSPNSMSRTQDKVDTRTQTLLSKSVTVNPLANPILDFAKYLA